MTLDSERGRILPPDLDDRTWQDLVDEMRALIPKYAPTWTDHNPSDIGISLIELFAWLVEGVIYRLNRVPDRNFLAFLNLIGATRNPPTPAATYLTYTGATDGEVLRAGAQAQTAAREGGQPVVFETDTDVTLSTRTLAAAVLVGPVTAAAATATYDLAAVGVAARPNQPGPAGSSLDQPAVPFTIAVPAGERAQLCLGFDKAADRTVTLRIRLHRPAVDLDPLTVSWVCSRPPDGAAAAAGPLEWKPVDAVADATGGLRHDGTVTLTVPGNWALQRPTAPPVGVRPPPGPAAPVWSTVTPKGVAVTDARFWIGMRVTNGSSSAVRIGVDRVLHNSVPAHTALTVRVPERVGESTGEPFQTFPLAHRPLFRLPDLRAPFGHLTVQVAAPPATPDAAPEWETWRLVDDLPAGAGRVYRLNPVTGEISFGDHDERTGAGHGSVPPARHLIRATYRYVATGAAGNVAAGQVVSPVSGSRDVVNLGAGRGGTDEEPIDDAIRRAPQELRIRDRAVTADDFEYLAREVSTEVVAARCLTPRLTNDTASDAAAGTPWTFAGIIRSPGTVNLIVVADQGADVPRPQPTPDLLGTVHAHLDQRRDATTRLVVKGPVYLPVVVRCEIQIWPNASRAGVEEDQVVRETKRLIAAFLHPTHGGPAGTGWQIGQHVFSADLYRTVAPAQDVGYVAALQIRAGRPDYFPPPGRDGDTSADAAARPFPLAGFGTSVRLADYELVCGAPATEHVVTATVAEN